MLSQKSLLGKAEMNYFVNESPVVPLYSSFLAPTPEGELYAARAMPTDFCGWRMMQAWTAFELQTLQVIDSALNKASTISLKMTNASHHIVIQALLQSAGASGNMPRSNKVEALAFASPLIND